LDCQCLFSFFLFFVGASSGANPVDGWWFLRLAGGENILRIEFSYSGEKYGDPDGRPGSDGGGLMARAMTEPSAEANSESGQIAGDRPRGIIWRI
jgi:hypothetical protein